MTTAMRLKTTIYLSVLLAQFAVTSGASADARPPVEISNSLRQFQEHLLENFQILRSNLTANLFRITRVSIEGNYYLKDDEILKLTGLIDQPALSKVSLPHIADTLRAVPWVEDVQLHTTVYPSTLALVVKEAKPWFVAEFSEASWLVARNGKPILPLNSIHDPELIMESLDLPRLDGIVGNSATGESLSLANQKFLRAVQILQSFQLAGGFPFRVERFSFLPDGSGIVVIPLQAAEFPQLQIDASDLSGAQTQLAKLKSVLRDLSSRNEQAASLDLRYSGQAVVRLTEAP